MRGPARLPWMVAAAVMAVAVLSGCGGDPPPAEDAGTPTPGGVGPSLLASVPQGGSVGARADTAVILEFSEPVAPASLTVSASPAVDFGVPVFEYGDTVVTLSPVTPLAASTHYVVQGAVADVEGNRGEFGFEFTTADPDTTPPALSSSEPPAGAADVAIDQPLVLTFSEAISPASFTVSVEPPAELAPPEWTEDGTRVTLTPATAWKVATGYTVTIVATDVAGNPLPQPTTLGFTTLKPTDKQPPTVVGAAPPANAGDVPATANIAISFSEAMTTTATEAAFSVTPPLACDFSWDPSRTLLTCDPQGSLMAGAKYAVSVSTVALDTQGNALAAPFTFAFTTSGTADTAPPTVASTLPVDASIGVARGTNVTVQFSESMDRLSTQAAFAISDPPGASAGSFSWDPLSTTLTFHPATPFAYGAEVKWAISSGAKDLAGNALQAAGERTFKVVQSATVDLSPAFDGHVRSDATTCTNCSNLIAGDDALKRVYRAYLSFSLSGLPVSTTKISAATLFVYQSACEGGPYNTLGALRAESVLLGATLDAADYSVPTTGGHVFTAATSCGGARTLSTSVVSAVADDWAARATRGGRSQFRLRFATGTDADATADRVLLNAENAATEKPYLRVTYEYP